MDDPFEFNVKFAVHHQLPEDDWIEHEEGMDCICGPYVVNIVPLYPLGTGVVIIAHPSLDNREGYLKAPDAGAE